RLDVFDTDRFADGVVGVVGAHRVWICLADHLAFSVVRRREGFRCGVFQAREQLRRCFIPVGLAAFASVAAVADFLDLIIVFGSVILVFRGVAARIGVAFQLAKRVVHA